MSIILLGGVASQAQSISGGTVGGLVSDPSGAAVANARVELKNSVTGYDEKQVTGSNGTFRFTNVPQNNYHLTVEAEGFDSALQDIDVHTTRPISVRVALTLASASTVVNVQAVSGLIENDPSAHQDIDRSTFLKLPV